MKAKLDPLEIRRHKQLRRCWRERARRQRNRCANRAVIVIVGRNLRRDLLGRVGEPDLLGYGGMRIASQGAQMQVTEGERDLQRQRNQRQHRSVLSMVLNPAHPQFTTYPDAMLAL